MHSYFRKSTLEKCGCGFGKCCTKKPFKRPIACLCSRSKPCCPQTIHVPGTCLQSSQTHASTFPLLHRRCELNVFGFNQ